MKAKAGVVQAEDALNEAKAAAANAQAALAKEKAADELAKTREQMFLNVSKLSTDAISRLRVDEAIQQRMEADAAVRQAEEGLKQAQAAEQEARSALAAAQAVTSQAEAAALQALFAVAVADSAVPGVKAQLDDARFNLAQCRMTAPADAYVVNWQIQVGTMLVPSPAAAAGTFVETSSTDIAAVFSQNYLGDVRPGDDVELVLDPYPGRLFTGKVDSVIAASGGGQFITMGTIPTTAKVGSTGAYAVRINFRQPPGTLLWGRAERRQSTQRWASLFTSFRRSQFG